MVALKGIVASINLLGSTDRLTLSLPHELETHLPVIGNLNLKSPTTRWAIEAFNTLQMSFAEAYINGLELPDSVVKSILDSFLPIVYRKFPSLLIPYDWVTQESDRLAVGSQELMNIQYNLPTQMFKLILGEGKIIYPKYSVALWEQGANNLEQAQQQMLDDLIAKA